jgi:hypothetical protein
MSPFKPQKQTGGGHITGCGQFRVPKFLELYGALRYDKRSASPAHGPARPQKPVVIQDTEGRAYGNLRDIETALPHPPVEHFNVRKQNIQPKGERYSFVRKGVKNKSIIWTGRIPKGELIQFQPRFIRLSRDFISAG